MTPPTSEPQSPPRLSVVEEPAETEAAAAPRKRRSRANWLLLVVMLLFAWMWLHQLEQTQRLAGDLASLETELRSSPSATRICKRCVWGSMRWRARSRP